MRNCVSVDFVKAMDSVEGLGDSVVENAYLNNDVEYPAQFADHTYTTRAVGQEHLVHGKSIRLGKLRYKNMCRKGTSYESFKSQITSDNVMWRHH